MPEGSKRLATGTRHPSVGTVSHANISGSQANSSGGVPVVAIGASAGGLDACRKLMDALPQSCGMAFILVQHLDPNHKSMMVELLAGQTSMKVQQAADGMRVEPDHLYVIPPGAYLSVAANALRLVAPQARHGARLPLDYLLHALADHYGPLAACLILSGTGTDGSLGAKSIREKSGLVIAQKPEEAAYDGMPRSAIESGCVDRILAIADMPAALLAFRAKVARTGGRSKAGSAEKGMDVFARIISLLREKTAHDFSQYKTGTLQRRIERRMGLSGIDPKDGGQYLSVLQSDSQELGLLAADLLINVTSFFRDATVFKKLEASIIPEMVRNHSLDQPMRLWVAGCSTGEEAYSLAMLFIEQIAAENRNIKLQVFASDVDPEAIASARDGRYPDSISADVSPERLARFFTKEDQRYKVSAELRAAVIFTVQDVLADPPFSRIDLVSCRNLLIYLGPEAQAKVIALFHFALRQSGILLLGSAETVGNPEGRFEEISKPDRLYRTIGRSRLQDFGIAKSVAELGKTPPRPGQPQVPSRQAALSDLCRRLVLDKFAPAAVLINGKSECLYSLGPIHRYLRVAQGHPTQDLLSMAAGGLRTKLRSAIHQAAAGTGTIVVPGGEVDYDGASVSFEISAQSVPVDGEQLILICFIDGPTFAHKSIESAPRDESRIAELESELEATKTELQGAIHNLEISGEEQKAINEEALSVNEEYQSTNEELLTSKEELQSLNEELTALNNQLQETLDRQRTTANDLQNILYSTDVATLFLDMQLKIRFFTPATRSLFNVIAGDIGRPLADLNPLSADLALENDARQVLLNSIPIEREIETDADTWFIRRILPYRTHDSKVGGVVIIFTDISERKAIRKALEVAKQEADLANVAKSRFLAAASHDLRQPLQTLTLLQALLARTVTGEKVPKLVARMADTLSAMSGMLNTLLDINQIEAGVVHAKPVSFPINDLLDRLRDEFSYHAQAQQLTLRVVPCSLHVHSDPRLLEQMIRNLLSNALKYTKCGKVLIGCRRRAGAIRIEIWDTGIGIPDGELQAIFEEYHQLDNVARERTRGLGLGLSIVQRLVRLLGHRIHVRSRLGKGSVFAIEVVVPVDGAPSRAQLSDESEQHDGTDGGRRQGTILLVEDDPDVRELVEQLLVGEGHRVLAAPDGHAALDLVGSRHNEPDLVLADFNLPKGMNGLQVADRLREKLRRNVPVIVMTGDISTTTMRNILDRSCVQLNKPVKLKEMMEAIDRLLSEPRAPLTPAPGEKVTQTSGGTDDTIYIVDDDANVCEGFRALLQESGHAVETFPSSETFLEAYKFGLGGCLLIDAYLPGMSGLDLLHKLRDRGDRMPAIMITGNSDVPMAVKAMKVGAADFIEKPVGGPELLAIVSRALEQSRDAGKATAWRESAATKIASLSTRQRQVLELVLAGHPSKNIAADLGLSQRTVENHRAFIMKKTGAKSLPALARLALAASTKL